MFNWTALAEGLHRVLPTSTPSSYPSSPSTPVSAEAEALWDVYIERDMLRDAAVILDQTAQTLSAETALQAVMRMGDAANAQFQGRWLVLFASLRKSLAHTMALLRPVYCQQTRDFWRRQMVLHTCWWVLTVQVYD